MPVASSFAGLELRSQVFLFDAAVPGLVSAMNGLHARVAASSAARDLKRGRGRAAKRAPHVHAPIRRARRVPRARNAQRAQRIASKVGLLSPTSPALVTPAACRYTGSAPTPGGKTGT